MVYEILLAKNFTGLHVTHLVQRRRIISRRRLGAVRIGCRLHDRPGHLDLRRIGHGLVAAAGTTAHRLAVGRARRAQ